MDKWMDHTPSMITVTPSDHAALPSTFSLWGPIQTVSIYFIDIFLPNKTPSCLRAGLEFISYLYFSDCTWMVLNKYLLPHCRKWQRKCAKMFNQTKDIRHLKG